MISLYGENGKIGEVSLMGGKVAGSTPAVHDVVSHMLRKHGTPQKAFQAMAADSVPFVLTDGNREYAFEGFSIIVADPPPWDR